MGEASWAGHVDAAGQHMHQEAAGGQDTETLQGLVLTSWPLGADTAAEAGIAARHTPSLANSTSFVAADLEH